MKTIFVCFVFFMVVPIHAQEPEKYIFRKERQAVTSSASGMTTRMEVIDRTADGALVQTYSLERKYNDRVPALEPFNGGGPRRIYIESNEPIYQDVRSNGEILFVRGMVNGVGVGIGYTSIYDAHANVTIKGTAYRVFSLSAPEPTVKYTEATVKSLNPAWIKWAENERAKQKQREAERILAYQLQRASNGYPSFQLELGKKYLRGDGVETNLALARHWLQAACTNGESQASNLLRQITELNRSKPR